MNLTGSQIKDTYEGLLNIGATGLTGALQTITDGLGNPLPMQVSNTTVNFTGIVTGIVGTTGPAGPTGATGAQGPIGPTGAAAPGGSSPITIENTNSLVSTGVGATGTSQNQIIIGSCAASSASGQGNIVIGVDACGRGTDALYPQRSSISIGTCSDAYTSSVAIGQNAKASGGTSIAIGEACSPGANSLALIRGSCASGSSAQAVGYAAFASGDYSLSYGLFACSTAAYAIAIGRESIASGACSTAIGFCAVASSGYSAIAIGECALASGGNHSIAIGRVSCAGDGSVAIGSNVASPALAALSLGYSSCASGNYSINITQSGCATATGSIAIGAGANASNACSVALGYAITTEKDNTVHVNSLIAYGQAASKANAIGSTGTSIAVDWDNSNVQTLTITASGTLTMSNPIDGGVYTLQITQGAGGGHTITWSNVLWPGGTPPSLSITAGAVDILTFIYGPTAYFGNANLNFS